MSLLYHYCSVSVMESIITNRVLWLSNALKTNDSKEYKYFGEALTEYAKTTKTDSKSLLNVVDMIIAQCTVTKEKRYTPYICCFSEADDLLSQWRGYGDDGKGVAIGFDFNKSGQLVEKADLSQKKEVPFVTKIVYSDIENVQSARTVFHNMFPYLAVSGNRYKDEYDLGIWQAAVSAIKLKHYGFQEEKEQRIVWLDEESKLNEENLVLAEKFRINQGRITRYFEFELDIKNAIKEIVLGPKCRMKKDDRELQLFLRYNDLAHINIRESNIPYC